MSIAPLRRSLTFLLPFLFFCPAVSAQSGGELFTSLSEPARGAEPWVISRRAAEIDRTVLEQASFVVNLPEFNLTAFPEVREQGQQNAFTVETVRGTLKHASGSEGTFSLSLLSSKKGDDRGLHGVFTIDSRVFELSSRGKSAKLVLEEIDAAKHPAPGDPLPAPDVAGDSTAGEPTAADGGTRIDILVTYTPEAEAAAGGESAILSQINNGIALANQSYSYSQIGQYLNLVGTMKVQDSESGDFNTDLSRLQQRSDGYYDEVHAKRDELGADLVALLVKSTQYCGMAYLAPYNAGYAFSVTSRVCMSNHSFTHELGHNMGSHHDRANAGSGGGTAFDYSYGWRWVNDGYRSVMAYAPGTRTPYISNPNVYHAGEPTGTATDDNARSMNNVKSSVASFRSGPQDCVPQAPTISFTPSPVYVARGATQQFQLRVYNNDTACASRTFSLSAGHSAGWGTSLGTGSLTIAAQSSSATTLQLTVPSDAPEGQTQAWFTAADVSDQATSYAATIIDFTPPTAVQNLSGSSNKKGQNKLSWTAASDSGSGVGFYRVYRDGILQQTISGTSTSHTDSQTVKGVTYTYYLLTVDRAGNVSAASNSVSILAGGGGGGGGGGPKGGGGSDGGGGGKGGGSKK